MTTDTESLESYAADGEDDSEADSPTEPAGDDVPGLGMSQEAFDELTAKEQVLHVIEACDLHYTSDIAEVATYSEGHITRVARQLHDEGEVTRERDGRGYHYEVVPGSVGDADDRMAAADAGDDSDDAADDEDPMTMGDDSDDGRLPADRDYDWSKWELSEGEVPEYVPTNGELADIDALIRNRHDTGMLPHFAVSGPTGTAKTTLARNIAFEMNAPLFTVQCGEGLRVADLLGSPTYVGNETRWSDGKVTKALLASRERPVVLLLDEVNRAPPRSKALLFSMLDDRCQVTLDPRGGEVVKGDPMNLIVISTMNKGPNYMSNQIDDAEKRRLGPEWKVDHLGLQDKASEVQLVVERTPVCLALADRMVEAANDIREKAADTSPVEFGLSTALVLDWARAAASFEGMADPVVRAARRVFINPYYSGGEEEDLVTEVVNKHFAGCPVDAEGVEDYFSDVDATEDADGVLDCQSCGWNIPLADAAVETTAKMECPDCEATLLLHDA